MKLLPISSCKYCYFKTQRKEYRDTTNQTTTEPSGWIISYFCSRIGRSVTVQVYRNTIHPCCNLDEEGEPK